MNQHDQTLETSVMIRQFQRLIVRTFAERPASKKLAKQFQAEKAPIQAAVEVKLPEVGGALKNINVFANESDPVLLPDSQYPEWIWQARGSCRAGQRSLSLLEEMVAEVPMAKIIRNHNRERIRQSNQALKGASQ